jgi:hypothetical protein
VGAGHQGLAIGQHVIPPTLAIEVGREKPAGSVGADGIHAEGLFTPQVGFDCVLGERRESLVAALRAFYLWLLADSSESISKAVIVTCRRIAALTCFAVLPPLGVY